MTFDNSKQKVGNGDSLQIKLFDDVNRSQEPSIRDYSTAQNMAIIENNAMSSQTNRTKSGSLQMRSSLQEKKEAHQKAQQTLLK